jgi:hypothetical protein
MVIVMEKSEKEVMEVPTGGRNGMITVHTQSGNIGPARGSSTNEKLIAVHWTAQFQI